MQKLSIEHTTEYRFRASVQLLPHTLILRPRENHCLRITSSRVTISPVAQVRWGRDALDNSIALATFSAPTDSLRIESRVLVEHYDVTPLDFLVAEHALYHPFAYTSEECLTLTPFLAAAWPADRARVGEWLRAWSLGIGRQETFGLLDLLNRTIPRAFGYESREEEGVQSPAATLARGRGSCRDFAAFFVEACRYLGLAARFVSGYHTTYANEAGPGSTHAWAEVYLPGPGWKAFDPTAGVVAGSEHIAVAVARHPEAVPPVAGSYLGAATSRPEMFVSVRVVPG